MIILNKFLLSLVLCIQSFTFLKMDAGEKNMYPNAKLSSEKLDNFIGKAKKILEKKYDLTICGIGGGVRDKIWLIDMDFNKYGSPLTEREARKLIIAITQDLLDMANKDEQLRPHMENYPFTFKNVRVAIFSYTEDADDYHHPYITTSSVYEGDVSFTSFDPGCRPENVHMDIEETYEDSLKILSKEN